MTAPAQASAWRVQNAQSMRAALCELRRRLTLHAHALGAETGTARAIEWLVAAHAAEQARFAPSPDAAGASGESDGELSPALQSLVELAGLDAFETGLLMLAAAPSLDGAFARAYADLHDDPRRDYATLQLALSLFVDDATDRLLAPDCLMPSRALRSLRLVEVDEDERGPLLTRRLGVDERITNYLRGVNRIDAHVASYVAPIPAALSGSATMTAGTKAAALIGDAPGRWCTINLLGEADGGAREAARVACESLHLRAHLLDLRRFAAAADDERARLVALLGREALLAGMVVVVDATGVEERSTPALAVDELVATLAATLFVISTERWPGAMGAAIVRVPRPTRFEQRALWREALQSRAHCVNGAVESITQQFDLGPEAIADVVSRAALQAGEITESALWSACREQAGASLEDLARRIVPCYGWDDIVVGEDVRAQLRELAAQVQQRGRVYESWGFGAQLGRGRGITALFSGPSGTGKTMAAEILAAHLQLDLYRVDLAGVVSKFIGETEKNLRRVFDAAERSGAILFFDEADALFGNRTEVRDSHDRYANLEINYLLQRMEDYTGLAILATNRRTALDKAFLRRLRFVIDFPFPAADDRRRIWERVFPAQAALEELDPSLLSSLDLSGGNIKSIAVNAAFLAAAANVPIGMTHVVRAAAREYAKLSKPISAAEFGPYYAVARR
jgi:ATPase family protein associated with various cellular activities (AAA)/winged helix domain-containing protein